MFNLTKQQLNGRTLLGIGPVSKTVIDVSIKLSDKFNIPLLLIPSRRQIDCAELGGGYVAETKEFSEYVRRQNKNGLVYLARDHGGPIQGTNEAQMDYPEATERALKSYYNDIANGFDIIHIDPSLMHKDANKIKRDIYLYLAACEEMCKQLGKSVIYEIGTEEHGSHTSDLNDFEQVLGELVGVTDKIRFVVGNTGTYVKEMTNVGEFDIKQAAELVNICNRHNVFLKEHNLDYTDVSMLEMHPSIGIHSANVAPEFGVVETKELLNQLWQHDMEEEQRRFIEIAHNSEKWVKWMIKGNASDAYMRASICGHYIFNNPEVQEIKTKAQERFDLQGALDKAVEQSISKYLKAFGWL